MLGCNPYENEEPIGRPAGIFPLQALFVVNCVAFIQYPPSQTTGKPWF
jgi:hypothetical protein